MIDGFQDGKKSLRRFYKFYDDHFLRARMLMNWKNPTFWPRMALVREGARERIRVDTLVYS